MANTTVNAGHNHEYVIDSEGNGTAYQKCHPDYPTICHAHKIVNYQIQSAHSTDVDPVNGIGPHVHQLDHDISPLGTIAPSVQKFYEPDGDSLFMSM